MPRLPLLLAVTCLGTGALLLGGRRLLEKRPPLTPGTPPQKLTWNRRWSPDPARRREAALLLAATEQSPQRRRELLRSQGWGLDPLAAVVLKRDALDARALGLDGTARDLWASLERRFPDQPAAADALYYLGRERGDEALHGELRRRFPAHPAALAAAVEAGPDRRERRSGALHLARWGARWPGAATRLREVCSTDAGDLSAADRAVLARGLAQLRRARAALDCLGADAAARQPALAQLSADGRLELARALLAGDEAQKALAGELLLKLAASSEDAAQAEEAVRLLSERRDPDAGAVLDRLPRRWQQSAPVQAHRILAGAGDRPEPDPARLRAGVETLRRWPGDPASWDLQWELARERLLAGDWALALTLLTVIDADRLPPPLAARLRFWQGVAQQKLGRHEEATVTWRRLRLNLPGGYYGWRAAVRLGEGDLSLEPGDPPTPDPWSPLASGDARLDRLWRLGQRTEAWETWRTRRGGREPKQSADLLVEGRLRQAVGDDWTGLGQLERATLTLPPQQCRLLAPLERHLHPVRFPEAFGAAARREGLPLSLLLAVAKQESRFTPAVRSPVGAVGLLQLMPATAAELAGGPVAPEDLEDPGRNAELGARYLRQMLARWQRNILPAIASYNAGPGAVEGWIGPRLGSDPELWVEGIPYPETRLYVKKVLGNAWSYQEEPVPRC